MSTLWISDASMRKWILRRPCEIFHDKYDTVTERYPAWMTFFLVHYYSVLKSGIYYSLPGKYTLPAKHSGYVLTITYDKHPSRFSIKACLTERS